MALNDVTVADWGKTKEDYFPGHIDVQEDFSADKPCALQPSTSLRVIRTEAATQTYPSPGKTAGFSHSW